MSLLFDFAYCLLLILASPWLVFQACWHGKYRQGTLMRLTGRVPQRRGDHPCVWLHAVSVGEVNLLGKLIERIERARPDVECVISTTTRTGFALASKSYAPRHVFYSPLDFSWAVRAAMGRSRPDVLVLVELELWPNLIGAAARHGVAVTVVNGRLSERSFRGYQRIRPLIRPSLRLIDVFAVQNTMYADRFRRLGARPDCVHVTGSLKFEGACTDRDNPQSQQLAQLAGIQAEDIVFLAGSTQEPEESLALATYRELSAAHPELQLILVPRHPERFATVAEMLQASGVTWALRSRLDAGSSDPEARVLLVDTIGELGAWWGTAHVAYVGGSMGRRGGQNMIEPAAYGAVVSFGPHTQNFKDVVDQFLDADAAVVVQDGKELTGLVRRAIEDREFSTRLGRAARQLVTSQLGATEKTCQLLQQHIPLSRAPETTARHGQRPVACG